MCQIIYYLLADWRAAVQQGESRRRRGICTAAEKFYEELKQSVVDADTDTDTDTVEFTFRTYEPAQEDTEARLQKIIRGIKDNNKKKLELQGVLGIEFVNIKNTYIKKKCGKHVASTDMYQFINCMACTKLNDIKSFYKYINDVTSYSRDYVTYFIRIANLCRVYPKLLYATVSSDDMHKFFSYVARKIEVDEDFWHNTCV